MKADKRSRRTRKQWRQLVTAWRRGGESAAEFATACGLVESTLRWWARQFERERKEGATSAAMSLLPVRVMDAPTSSMESHGDRVAWTLRTSRGELTVYSADGGALHAAVASLVGAGT
jgi:transposase-like protein